MESRGKKKTTKKPKNKCRIFCTWGQKCTLRPEVVIQEDGLTGCSGKCSDVVNHCLAWLSEIMKTCEGKADITSAMVDESLCRGFSSLQIQLLSSCNGKADRTHWRSSQHVFNANWCACYTVTCVEPSCQYHFYSVIAALLGLLLGDMGMHGADKPEANNPSWLAPRLWQAHVDSWPCHQTSLVLPCLRSCAANCAIAKEPNCFQKHTCPLQGCTTCSQHGSLPWVELTYPDCCSAFLLWASAPNSQIIRTGMVLEGGDAIDVLWVPDHTELSCQEMFPRKHVYFPLTRGKLGIYNIRLSDAPQTSFLKTSRISFLLFSSAYQLPKGRASLWIFVTFFSNRIFPNTVKIQSALCSLL